MGWSGRRLWSDDLLESMLEGELSHHLAENKATGVSNRRNGKTQKTVRSLNSGHLEIESSRDREGTFAPKIIPGLHPLQSP